MQVIEARLSEGSALPVSHAAADVWSAGAVLFALLPLLRIRNIKPRLLLRDEFTEAQEFGKTAKIAASFFGRVLGRLSMIDPVRAVVACVVAVGLTGVAAWQANSFRVGSVFLLSLAATAIALYAVASR